MKTNQTVAVIVMLLGMLCCQDALAFYNSSTGRWLSRDPIEENDGPNIYAFAGNNVFNAVDIDGLKKLISFIVGRDKTIPTTKDQYYDRKLKEYTEEMKKNLEDSLSKCTCDEVPTVIIAYSKATLSAPKDGIWNVGDSADEALMLKNWNKLAPTSKGGSRASVPVFWTRKAIGHTDSDSKDDAGIGRQGNGIILSFDHWFPVRHLLGHELGHYAGYSGGDMDNHTHSSDRNNVMSYGQGNDPDQDWCSKVLALAKDEQKKK